MPPTVQTFPSTDTEAPAQVPAQQETTTTETAPTIREHLRGNKVTLTIPDEVLALSELTGKTPGQIIQNLLGAQLYQVRATIAHLIPEVVR